MVYGEHSSFGAVKKMLVNKLGVDVFTADVIQTSFYYDLNNSALDFLI